MDIHKLLKRQLDKTHLSPDKMPDNPENWVDFLSRVNKAYIEAEQERYLHERSMEISSRELLGLNEKLEKAQHLARLGYWYYDGKTDYALWSKELFTIFHLDPSQKPPSYQEFMELVHEKDRYEFEKAVQDALEHHIDYECEIRVRNPEGTYRWYRTIGQCQEGEKELSGVIIDIHQDKEAEEKIRELNQRLLDTARRAGMAEVAATILHNIGNILNSSNVSVSLLKNSYAQPYHEKFIKIIEMLHEHSDNIVDFLGKDPKGQLIPKYLSAISQVIIKEQQQNSIEVDNLLNDIHHIKEIVAMQKSVSGLSSMNEKIYVPEVIETAINMSMSSAKDDAIEITREFEACPLIEADKSKLLQILVNLIQNARDAVLLDSEALIKEIKLIIKDQKRQNVQIIISDNGVGIAPDNLDKIFSFGFTTKENGHGFGLHSAALSAQEMGGSLLAKSPGTGQGSRFILTLPVKTHAGKEGIFNE
ncbi:sensor histidine kinase [Legionella spiritensis]|uniref:histidine kinase n=1 Tax=Legionella spiritensis TaxID=452 RepID=A0A0W0Z6V7_LEGSP|nr:PAS domain-containing sensor histidine kinase [Legionella spiritensis]KTD64845.1 Two-component sensor histidine kinase [Legionella spiritensis]SNV40686.1 Two-component sensor histidine kinase [Legionella spiritensis]